MRRFQSLPIAFVLAPLVVVAACTTVPPRYGDKVRKLESEGLLEVNPNDIVIAPVIDQAEGSVPGEPLRSAFHELMPIKRYSPVSIEYADSRAIEAGFGPDTELEYRPGACQEDAVLEIVVHRWGDRLWELRSTLDVDIEARLIDARNPGPVPLWARRLDREFNFAGRSTAYSSERLKMEKACLEIARDLLSTLPPRETLPEAQAAPMAPAPQLEGTPDGAGADDQG